MSIKHSTPTGESIIRRLQPTSDETPPWAGIAFVYPVDSDELADQLKKAYPEGQNLRQRKHMAAIDFLKSELKGMQKPHVGGSAAFETVSNIDNDPQSVDTDVNDALPFESRPESAASPFSPSASSFVDSPRLAERTKQPVTQKHTPESIVPLVPGTPQTFVFSAADGRPMQPRTKKKMSARERQDYKKTRERGACLKCRRTKAKVFETPATIP
jgi:hypothetical protein